VLLESPWRQPYTTPGFVTKSTLIPTRQALSQFYAGQITKII
jgi:hypothetical protein